MLLDFADNTLNLSENPKEMFCSIGQGFRGLNPASGEQLLLCYHHTLDGCAL